MKTKVSTVKLDGRVVGHIHFMDGGYFYRPKGSSSKYRAAAFATHDACIRSLGPHVTVT